MKGLALLEGTVTFCAFGTVCIYRLLFCLTFRAFATHARFTAKCIFCERVRFWIMGNNFPLFSPLFQTLPTMQAAAPAVSSPPPLHRRDPPARRTPSAGTETRPPTLPRRIRRQPHSVRPRNCSRRSRWTSTSSAASRRWCSRGRRTRD